MKYLALLSLLFLSSCSTTIDESKIAGKWMVEDLEVNAPDISPMLIQAAREKAISTVYTLYEDGTFKETSNYNPNGDEGIWEFHSSNNWLELTDVGVSGQVFIINSVNSKKMIWFQEMRDLGSLTFTLKKVN